MNEIKYKIKYLVEVRFFPIRVNFEYVWNRRVPCDSNTYPIRIRQRKK